MDDAEIGPTPAVWTPAGREGATAASEMYLMLCCSLVGEVFGRRPDRAGQLVHDVVPVAGHEQEQSSASSDVDLLWQTEEACHPLRGVAPDLRRSRAYRLSAASRVVF